MEAKEVKKLMEAYASVYTQKKEIIAEEDCECEEEESGKETPEMNGKKKGKKEKEEKEEEMKEERDVFDYLLEYLVAEGYADTNKAALAIMANMSEEWKQSIMEGPGGMMMSAASQGKGQVTTQKPLRPLTAKEKESYKTIK